MPSPTHIKLLQNDAGKGQKILAKTFVNELVKNGYSEAQVVLIAAEMIRYLNERMAMHIEELPENEDIFSFA